MGGFSLPSDSPFNGGRADLPLRGLDGYFPVGDVGDEATRMRPAPIEERGGAGCEVARVPLHASKSGVTMSPCTSTVEAIASRLYT